MEAIPTSPRRRETAPFLASLQVLAIQQLGRFHSRLSPPAISTPLSALERYCSTTGIQIRPSASLRFYSILPAKPTPAWEWTPFRTTPPATATQPPVIARCLATPLADSTPPTVTKRSLATVLAPITRLSVIARLIATRLAATTRPPESLHCFSMTPATAALPTVSKRYL